ncbi:MAG: family 43 glycosylhydrolase [Acidobacteriota bacterium]|nr:family 43 glycosylhydrolase [Acidobacteriota bacterium]
MRFRYSAAIVILLVSAAFGLDGQIGIHDPSTIIQCEGKYYTFGTGGGGLVSDDGWLWRRGASRPGGGVAPDVIPIGDRYYLYYSTSTKQPKADVHMIWNRTLDPNSAHFKWEEGGIVASSDGVEDCNAIDPAVFLDPATGKLWLAYGSYFGYIRLVQLDPKTGKRVVPIDKPLDIAINCEAAAIIYREGWYYLLATHGSCCRGTDSGYNIRVGRSRKVTGPFLDHMGIDMIKGGGKLFVGSGGRVVGPGHFGLLDLGDGVQKFSCHYEADLDRGGASVLDIRPLLWKDGWPVAGDNVREGTYEIESARTGTALELAVQGTPVGGARGRPSGGPGGMFSGTGGVIPSQEASQVSQDWPAGNIDVRLSNYMIQAQQKWTITPVPNAGGYPGSPYFKITIAGTDRALAATDEAELITVPAFTGTPEQLWRIDQLADGAYRLMPKAVPNSRESLAISAVGSSFATLARFDPKSDKQRWNLRTP